MGYRHYMYKIEKKVVKEVKDKDYEFLSTNYNAEWNEGTDEKWFDLHSLLTDQVYCFGKLYYEDTAERIYKHGVPMFTNKEVMEQLSDYQPYIVTKEALLEAITVYTEKVQKFYKELLEDGQTLVGFLGIETKKEISKEKKLIEFVEEQIREWGQFGPPYNLNDDTDYIVSSWKFEYAVFELVRLYKTIDFEKYDLVFLGY